MTTVTFPPVQVPAADPAPIYGTNDAAAPGRGCDAAVERATRRIAEIDAVQGAELPRSLRTSPERLMTAAAARAAVPALDDDRDMATDLKASAGLVTSGTLVCAISPGILPMLDV
jgi:histidine ammonia-lyase